MKSNQMGSFAAGIFAATTLLSATFFFGPRDVNVNQDLDEIPMSDTLSEIEMKDTLTSAGYVIHSKEEWAEHIATIEATENGATINSVAKEEKPVVSRTILTVSQGMTSIDIGKVLVQANMTDNAMSFFHEVEKRGLSNKLRPGTYEIDSDMTMNDVISLIFK